MIDNITILYVDDLQQNKFLRLSFVTFQRLSLSNYKMATPNKRNGLAGGTPKRDDKAKKHRSTLDRELFGLQSPFGSEGPPLASRRNVSPEDDILESKTEDGGSIILNFEALSASVESLACGKCGRTNYLPLRKLQNSQHGLPLPAKTVIMRSQPYQQKATNTWLPATSTNRKSTTKRQFR
jgi:hypothetical protein